MFVAFPINNVHRTRSLTKHASLGTQVCEYTMYVQVMSINKKLIIVDKEKTEQRREEVSQSPVKHLSMRRMTPIKRKYQIKWTVFNWTNIPRVTFWLSHIWTWDSEESKIYCYLPILG